MPHGDLFWAPAKSGRDEIVFPLFLVIEPLTPYALTAGPMSRKDFIELFTVTLMCLWICAGFFTAPFFLGAIIDAAFESTVVKFLLAVGLPDPLVGLQTLLTCGAAYIGLLFLPPILVAYFAGRNRKAKDAAEASARSSSESS